MPSRIEAEGKSNMAENPCPQGPEDFQQCNQQTKDITPHPEKRKLQDICLLSKQLRSLNMETNKIKTEAAPTGSPIRKNTTPPGPSTKIDDDKVTLFASHLAEVYTPHSETPDPDVESMLANHTKCLAKTRPFTASGLNQVIKKLPPTKTPGPDLITAQMIQELPPGEQKTFCNCTTQC